MSKKLIVVADDFGFSEAYNYGVIKAYKEGVVCTLSLMSNMWRRHMPWWKPAAGEIGRAHV